MAKPHADDIHRAVETAMGLAADESAEGTLARCFLYLHDRNQHLEEVYQHVENYMNTGMAEQEHARLVTALDHAREAQHRQGHEDSDEPLGL
ncbi:MAG: hypothetical protein WBO34_09730 [Gammaproteobacteria bacterium]